MRRTLAVTGVLAPLLAMAPASAQDRVAVFGVLDTYVDHSKAGNARATRVQSGGISGSRLGFRGSEDLGPGTKAIFLLEAGINLDDGSSGQGGLRFGRQAWAGLGTAAGELILGRHYAPYFFTLVSHGLGGGMGWGNASNYFTDNSVLRVNNSISYASPSVGGVKARALVGFGENASLPGGDSIGSIHSASLQVDQGGFSANLAYLARKTTVANTERFYAAGASYQFGRVKAGLLLQARRGDTGAAENDAAEFNLLVPAGPGAFLFDVGRFRSRSVDHANALAASVRYDYHLSKRSILYAGAARIRNDANARFGINGNTGAALAVAPGQDPRSLIVGVRHTF
ncbi:porin [Massilia niastensis]|uniref:porin n=1 Tax=Massilia niastensis TaxID=544911 RepID=UPI0012EBFB7A|nr:porin [Massilia niastensis]